MWVRMEKAGEWVGGRDFYTVVFLFFVDSSPRTSFLLSSETSVHSSSVHQRLKQKAMMMCNVPLYQFSYACENAVSCVCYTFLVLRWGCVSVQVEQQRLTYMPQLKAESGPFTRPKCFKEMGHADNGEPERKDQRKKLSSLQEVVH